MPYINSAGVKFNDKADLIIEEDGAGNVTSCYNRSNNKNYVYPVKMASVLLTNNSASARNCYTIVITADGFLKYNSMGTIAPGGTRTLTPALGTIVGSPSGTKIAVVSGDFEIVDSQNVVPYSDGEITIEDI